MNGKYIDYVPVGYTGGPNDTSILPPSPFNGTLQALRRGHQDPNIILLREVIEVWLCTPITILGDLGNLVSLAVLCHMRKGKLRPVATMLQALAVSDTLVLVASFWLRTLRYLTPEAFVYYHAITFPVLFSTNYVLRLVNTWITVLLTFDRYVVVCHPLHAQSLCTTRRTHIQIVCVIVASFAFCVPRYFESRLEYTPTPHYRTTWLMDDPLYAVIYRMFLFLLVQYLLPMLILIGLNGRVVCSLRFNSANQPRFTRPTKTKHHTYNVASLKTTHTLLKALVLSTAPHDAKTVPTATRDDDVAEDRSRETTQDVAERTPARTQDEGSRSPARTEDAGSRSPAITSDVTVRSPVTTQDESAQKSAVTPDTSTRTPATTHDIPARSHEITHETSARTHSIAHDEHTPRTHSITHEPPTTTRKSSSSSAGTFTQDASTATSTATSQHATARTLTRIVVTVVLLCTVCHVVSMVSHVLLSVQTAFHQLPGIDLCRRYFSNVSNLLITFNSAVNFLIYCALSRNFRAILSRCLTGVCRRGRHPLRAASRRLYHVRRPTTPASSGAKRGSSPVQSGVCTPISMNMVAVKRSRAYQGVPPSPAATPCSTSL